LISKKSKRAEIIRWLGAAIRTETEKPFDEIDYDLVEECGCLLDELMDESLMVSCKDVDARIAEIQKKVGGAQSVRKKRRGLRYAIIAAALVLCMCITVVSVPTWKQAVLTALQLDAGGSVNVGGITCVRNGREQRYSTIEDLMQSENLNFSPPMIETEKPKLEKVIHYAEIGTVYLCFDDTSISYEIWLSNTDIVSYTTHAEEYTNGKHTTYVIPQELSGKLTYFSYTLIDDDIHVIASHSLETIELLISNIQ